jgi:hypothetical protein
MTTKDVRPIGEVLTQPTVVLDGGGGIMSLVDREQAEGVVSLTEFGGEGS